jgi:hypothetical protein
VLVPAQLLGQLPDLVLGVLGRLQPGERDFQQGPVGPAFQLRQLGDLLQQLPQLLLAAGGQEIVEERLEALPLIGLGDLVAVQQEGGQLLALAALRGGEPAQTPVQFPQVRLHFAEVPQEFDRGALQLLVAVQQGERGEEFHFPGKQPGDLGVDRVTFPAQLIDARLRTGLGTERYLP